MRTAVRGLAGTIVCLVALSTVGVAGLVFAEAVPDVWVIDALEEGEASGALDPQQQPIDPSGAGVDEFTECITVSIGLGETADQGLFNTVALAPFLGSCGRLMDNLNPYDGTRAAENRSTYLRYWHGSTPVVRPTLALFGVGGLRVVNLLAIVLAGTLLFRTVRRTAGTWGAVGLVSPVLLTTSITSLPNATNQALAFAAGLVGAAFVARVAANGITAPRIWFSCLVAGAAFVYVDLLTVVPGQWLLVAALVGLAAFQAGKAPLPVLGWTVTAGIAWMVGYAGMWAGKWVFAALVLGRERVSDDVRSTIELRINGESDFSEQGIGYGVVDNLDAFTARPFVGTLVLITIAVVFVMVERRPTVESVTRFIVASTALVPLVWYEVLSNHSQIHAWFTYRSLPMAMGVVLLVFLTPAPERSNAVISEPAPVSP
ncbi:MAG: hypothetical protein AAGA37_11130 [Actinomycetota bacterium]